MTASSSALFSMHSHKHIPKILGMGLFLQQLDSMILNTAIPQMAESLGTSALSLKLAITSYLLTLALFIPISGYVADRFGTRKTFSMAMLVFLLGSVICGLSLNMPMLIIGRLIQGMGGAMVTPVGRLILIRTFPKADFLSAFAAYTVIGQLGSIMGPVLGGFLTTFLDWRFIFFVNVPLVLMALYWVKKFIPNHYDRSHLPKFDWIGFLVFGGAAGAITFGASWMTENNFSDSAPWLFLIIGGLLGVIYFLYTKRVKFPALDIKVFKIRSFSICIWGGNLFRFGTGGITFLLPLELQIGFGYSAFKAGLLILPNAVAFLVARYGFKKILKKYGFKKTLVSAPFGVALGLFGLAWVNANTSLWVIVILMIVIGLASSVQYGCLNTLNFAEIAPRRSSQATSVSAVFQQIAFSLSICFCAALLVLNSHFFHVPQLSQGTFHATYLILTLVTIGSALSFLTLHRDDGMKLLK